MTVRSTRSIHGIVGQDMTIDMGGPIDVVHGLVAGTIAGLPAGTRVHHDAGTIRWRPTPADVGQITLHVIAGARTMTVEICVKAET